MSAARICLLNVVAIASVFAIAAMAQPGFRVAPGYPTGINAYSIAVEDYNGDGIPDMAVVNYNNGNAGTVSILIGNGDGTFKSAVNYTTGLGPRFIAAGDFNNDGKWDFVTANELDNTVTVFLGNGDGTFSAQPATAVGSHPWNVQVGDFNQDGNLDAVVANNTGNSVQILFGNGSGGFNSQSNTYATGPQSQNNGQGVGPIFTRVADLNNDGILDLAVANFSQTNTSGYNIAVLLGNSDGTFQNYVPYSTNSNAAVSIVAVDLNGDGIVDLAVANELGAESGTVTTGNVTVFLGTGNGAFGSGTNYTVGFGSHPRSVAAYKFTSNGHFDLVIGDDGSDDVAYLSGNGDGSFQAAVRYGAGYQPRYITLADFNQDGNEDVAVANFAGNSVTVLLGFGDGSFNSSLGTSTGNIPKSVVSADFNGDGKLDQAVVNNGDSTIGVELGNGDGTFQPMVTYSTGNNPGFAVAADVNGDGAPDLIVVNQGNNNVSVFLNNNNGTGTFENATTSSAGTSPTSATVGDFNADGKLDLAISNQNGVAILLNNGSGGFPSLAQYSAGGKPISVTTADFNGDGILDLAVANNGANNVSILLGQGSGGKGNGSFASPKNINVGKAPYSLVAADFNNDKNVDLAVANSGANSVSILLGTGKGTFGSPVNYPTDTTPEFVTVVDVNSDGKLDLVTANEGVADVSYLQGNGDGTFQSQIPFTVGTNPISLTVGDFNMDGAPDLLAANLNSDTTTTLLNSGGTYLSTSSSVNPSNANQSVTFTTTIAASLRNGGTPTGTITFEDGTTFLGQGSISGGVATYTTSSLAIGTHTINAIYSGDSNFDPNAAPPYTQTVLGSGPIVSLNPTSLTFALTLVGTISPTQTITLTNNGNSTLTISQIAVTGANAVEFKLVTGGTCGTSLSAGASCNILVEFKPNAAGTASASVSITDNATGSPQSVPLSGTGTVLKLTPTSMNFNKVQVGKQSTAQKVTMKNVSATTVTFTQPISIGGTNPNDFSIQSSGTTCGTTLAGGATCTVSIIFGPLAKGARSATLIFTDNGGGSPQDVSLSGTGE